MTSRRWRTLAVGMVLLTLPGCGIRTDRESYIEDPLGLLDPDTLSDQRERSAAFVAKFRNERLVQTTACSYFWPHRLGVRYYRVRGTNDNFCPPVLWFWEEAGYPWDGERGEW